MKKGGVSQDYMPGKETRVEGVDIFEASSMTSTFANTAFVQSSQKMWETMMEMSSLCSQGYEYYI